MQGIRWVSFLGGVCPNGGEHIHERKCVVTDGGLFLDNMSVACEYCACIFRPWRYEVDDAVGNG